MQVHKEGDHWVIARNFQIIDANGIGGGRSRSISRVRETYENWTGTRWIGQRAAAMTFPTKDAAQQYLEENWSLLEQGSSL